MEMMIFKVHITSEDPATGKATSDIEIDGDLGSLASAVCALMKKEPGVAEVLTTAVDDYKEQNSTYP